ncbi:MAG: MFS transporter, partial [Gemmatimonadetes bacterium]
SVTATDCHFHLFVGPWSKFTDCDRAKDFLARQGISFQTSELPAGSADKVTVKIGATELHGWNEADAKTALAAAGFPAAADKSGINYFMTELILVIMVIYVTMVYGPIAAYLVELFPARIRYTSMSLPYHIGNGWFGGMLPLLATAIVAAAGNIYYGLWYPIVVAVMTFVVGTVLIKETKDHKVRVDL